MTDFGNEATIAELKRVIAELELRAITAETRLRTMEQGAPDAATAQHPAPHLRFLEAMDKVNRVMQSAHDVEEMTRNVLDTLLTLFDCDRAWLLYPCDPDVEAWWVPMERTTPQFPGAFAQDMVLPMTAEVSGIFQLMVSSEGPITFGHNTPYPLPDDIVEAFQVYSQIAVCLRPKIGKAWMFGLHQCHLQRDWTDEDIRIFQEIGRRLSDALTSLLAYQNLQASEQRYREVFEASSECISLIDVEDTRFKFVGSNPAFDLSTGYHPADLAGSYVDEVLSPAIANHFIANYRRCLDEGVAINFDEQLDLPAGRRYFKTTLLPVRNDKAEVYRIVGIGRDVTQQVRVESDLSLLTYAMNHVHEAAYMLNEAGRFIYVNEETCRELGYRRDELLAMSPVDIDPDLKPEDIRAIFADDHRRMSMRYEAVYRRRDGSVFPVEVTVTCIEYEQQKLAMCLARDITERKRIEKMKNEFVSTVSHELRTPLTSVCGALALIQSFADAIPQNMRQMFDIAHRNALRLSQLINDLLDMERLSAGMMQFDLRVQPLMPLVEQAIENNSIHGKMHGLRYHTVNQAGDVYVNVDASRLQQVISNYLSNAVKFSPDAGCIDIVVQSGEIGVRVEVIDQGPGVPEAFRERIFQKFSQADSSDTRQKSGTGLGLAICKELIEQMQGSVGYESQPGRTCFYFELPQLVPVSVG